MNILPLALIVATCLTAAPGHRRSWDLGQYSWVKLERQEAGAVPSAQPVKIPAATLSGMLASLLLTGGGEQEPLFSTEEVTRFAGPMAEALALADPGEDLIFMSTAKHGGGFMAPRLTVTGRMFVLAGRLNVIIQETRLDYDGRARANAGPPMPTNGQRQEPSPAMVSASGAASLRRDWVAFPLELALAAPRAAPAPLPGQAAPALPPSAAERLRALKHLRDENLLTEEEYQKKRQEIIKDL